MDLFREILLQKKTLEEEHCKVDEKVQEFEKNRKATPILEECSQSVQETSNSCTLIQGTSKCSTQTAQLKAQCSLEMCNLFSKELTQLKVLKVQQARVTMAPTKKRGHSKTSAEVEIWQKIIAKCCIKAVPFFIEFYRHVSSLRNQSTVITLYRDLRVLPTRNLQKIELAKSLLNLPRNAPSEAVYTIMKYADAYISRRRTCNKLNEKYGNILLMKNLPRGGISIKSGSILKLTWRIQRKFSILSPYYHKLRMDLDYIDESRLKIIIQTHEKLRDPSIKTKERTRLLSIIISTCLEYYEEVANDQNEAGNSGLATLNVQNNPTSSNNNQIKEKYKNNPTLKIRKNIAKIKKTLPNLTLPKKQIIKSIKYQTNEINKKKSLNNTPNKTSKEIDITSNVKQISEIKLPNSKIVDHKTENINSTLATLNVQNNPTSSNNDQIKDNDKNNATSSIVNSVKIKKTLPNSKIPIKQIIKSKHINIEQQNKESINYQTNEINKKKSLKNTQLNTQNKTSKKIDITSDVKQISKIKLPSSKIVDRKTEHINSATTNKKPLGTDNLNRVKRTQNPNEKTGKIIQSAVKTNTKTNNNVNLVKPVNTKPNLIPDTTKPTTSVATEKNHENIEIKDERKILGNINNIKEIQQNSYTLKTAAEKRKLFIKSHYKNAAKKSRRSLNGSDISKSPVRVSNLKPDSQDKPRTSPNKPGPSSEANLPKKAKIPTKIQNKPGPSSEANLPKKAKIPTKIQNTTKPTTSVATEKNHENIEIKDERKILGNINNSKEIQQNSYTLKTAAEKKKLYIKSHYKNAAKKSRRSINGSDISKSPVRVSNLKPDSNIQEKPRTSPNKPGPSSEANLPKKAKIPTKIQKLAATRK